MIKILFIGDDLIADWLRSSILVCEPEALVVVCSNLDTFSFSEMPSEGLIITTEALFNSMRQKLDLDVNLRESMFAFLVLTEGFKGEPDIDGIDDVTIDTYAIEALSPILLRHQLVALERDYNKDKKLKKMAHYDELTGATNRHLFNDRVKQSIKQFHRSKDPISLLYFDLDKFKSINDNYGHSFGDAYLQEFVLVIRDCIRDSDTIGRLGGDEFAVLLPRTSIDSARNIGAEILNLASVPRSIQDRSLCIGVSIGGVSVDADSACTNISLRTLTDEADKAVYIAKKNADKKLVIHTLLG